MIAVAEIVRWTHTNSGDYEGTGEHALYKVHRLSKLDIGVGQQNLITKRGKWMIARKLGEHPFKVIGGPYDTAREAQQRAESLEAQL